MVQDGQLTHMCNVLSHAGCWMLGCMFKAIQYQSHCMMCSVSSKPPDPPVLLCVGLSITHHLLDLVLRQTTCTAQHSTAISTVPAQHLQSRYTNTSSLMPCDKASNTVLDAEASLPARTDHGHHWWLRGSGPLNHTLQQLTARAPQRP